MSVWEGFHASGVFIEGRFGESPLQPPLGVLRPDGDVTNEPTPLELANFVEHAVPGALYTDTCPCHADENVKVFEIAMVQAKVTYNRYGWHDPQARFFVLKEELERHGGLECYIQKVEEQQIKVEPLVIRANAGDCIELRTTNLLPEYIEASPFQHRTRTDIVGHHVHLVKFDTIVSDGSANGWNNIAGARRYETLLERFFANEELQTVFFHDHLFANVHQQHGLFGALIIEEAGATFHNPQNGKELNSGTQAVIRRRNGTSFREFALFVHDFALLFDKNGKPLNPPEVPGSHDDPGVMGINYRSEPMRERLRKKEDPAYLFSSFVHGDPATPILETYPGDELMIRLIDGAHEEQHSFNVTGMSWRKERADPKSPLAVSQTIGISEAFNLNVTENYGAGDYLYYFGGIDDAWLGLWGIIRVHRRYKKHLQPLCQGKGSIQPLPPCPSRDDVIRRYEVVAIQKKLIYNRYGDHDPNGLVFVPLEDVDAVLLQSFADMRNHRYHGLFGAVIVEPPGAEWYRNFTKKKDSFAEQAVITAPGEESFREYVLFIQNGIRLLDTEGNLIETAAADNGEPVDAEDTGEKGYNYASERFANRLARDPRTWKVFSSKVHGDPATPVWKAYPGDRIVFRVMMPADKPRNTSIAVHDHIWREQHEDPFSRIIPLQGGVSVGNKFDIELQDGAGCPGDYLYRSGSFAWDVESGMWGIFRVVKQTFRHKCKAVYKKIRNCF